MKKKIAVIGLKGLPGYGGAAAVGENIIKGLQDKYDFTVYSVDSHTDVKNLPYCRQIVFKSFGSYRVNIIIYLIKSTLHALFKDNYDMIHIHHNSSAFILFFIRLKYKTLLTTHGIFSMTKKNKKIEKYFIMLNLKLIKLSNLISCISLNEKRNFDKMNYVVKFIPNGVNHVDIKNDLNKEGIVFCANRIVYNKGLHLLLEAKNQLNFDIHLKVIGDTSHDEKYIMTLSEKIKNDVEFVGLLKNKKTLFDMISQAKLFIFPSYSEGMSMTLLEVSSLEVPIICSDIVANRDIFSDNEVLYFKTGDSNDLKEKIEWAYSHYDDMLHKAKRAKEKVLTEYSWKEICKQYSQLYDSIIYDKEEK